MRQDLLSNALIFMTGVAVGSLATYAIVKYKNREVEYEEIAPEATKDENAPVQEPDANKPVTKPNLGPLKKDEENMIRYNKVLQKAGYTEQDETEEDDYMNGPHVIAADEFAEEETYDTVTLYCYADGVLTDENDEIIDDVEGTVGKESLRTFEVDGYDSVFVRNDEKETYYEVLRDKRRYFDIYGTEE